MSIAKILILTLAFLFLLAIVLFLLNIMGVISFGCSCATLFPVISPTN